MVLLPDGIFGKISPLVETVNQASNDQKIAGSAPVFIRVFFSKPGPVEDFFPVCFPAIDEGLFGNILKLTFTDLVL